MRSDVLPLPSLILPSSGFILCLDGRATPSGLDPAHQGFAAVLPGYAPSLMRLRAITTR